MAARGELVGDAYVRIFADTRFMKRALERDLRRAAKASADNWLDDFNEQIERESDRRLAGARKSLVESIVGGDFDQMLRKSGKSIDDFYNTIRKGIDQTQKDAEERFRILGKNTTELRKNFDQARESLDKWADKARLREFNEQIRKSHEEAIRLNKDFDNFTKRLETARRKALDLTRGLDPDVMRRFGIKINDAFSQRNLDRIDMLGRAVGRYRTVTEAAAKVTEKVEEKARKAHDRFTFMRRSIDNLSDSMRGMSHRGGILADILTAPVRLITRLGQVSSSVLSPLEKLGANMGGFGGNLISTIPGLAAFVVFIGAAIAILPAFVSAVSLAAGAVTALVGSITIGLIGALLPLGPLILGVATAVTTLILGFRGLEKANRLHAFDDLIKAFGHIKKMVASHLFSDLDSQIRHLRDTLTDFGGDILVNSADQLREAANRFLSALDSPRMERVLQTYTSTLPKIVGDLGDAFGDFILGLLGFFEPILSFGKRLSSNLAGLAEDFRRWATSARGRNEIADFMDKAWESAGTLWDIIKQVTRALSGLFSAGEDSGQGMLESIDKVVRKFADWTNSKQGREDLKQWFKDAKRFAGELVGAIGDIGGALGDLDTEESRQDLIDLLHALGDIARWANGHSDTFAHISDALRFTIPTVGVISAFKKLKDFDWGGLGSDIVHGFVNGMTAPLHATRGAIIAAFRAVIDWVRGLFGVASPSTVFFDIGHDVVQGFINGVRSLASGMWGRVSGAFTGFTGSVRSWAGRVVSAAASRISNLPGRIADALKGLPGSVAGPFRGAVGRAGSLAQSLVSRSTGFLSRLPGRAGKAISGLTGRVGGVFSSARARAGSLASTLVSRAVGLLAPLPNRARGAISGLPGRVGSVFSSASTRARSLASTLVSRAVGLLGNLPGRASSAISGLAGRVGGQFARAVSSARGGAGHILGAIGVLGSLPGRAAGLVAGVVNAIAGPFRTAYAIVRGIVGSIAGLVGQARSIASTVASIVSHIPHPHFATGGIVYGSTTATIGEDGPEAIVPLRRPLSQVDPAVRALSAIAQGKASAGSAPAGNVTYNSFSEGAIKVITPARDGRIVAEQVLDRIVTSIA